MRAVTASIENVITTQNSTGNDDEEYLTFLVLFLMDIKYDGALKMKCFNDFLLTEVVLFPTFARKAFSQAEGDDKGRFLTEKRKKSSSYCNLYWKIMFPFQSVILQSNKNTPSDCKWENSGDVINRAHCPATMHTCFCHQSPVVVDLVSNEVAKSV